MTTLHYKVPNISCGHCTHTIKMEVEDIDGVESVEAVEATQEVTITFGDPATETQIVSLMKEINYPPAAA